MHEFMSAINNFFGVFFHAGVTTFHRFSLANSEEKIYFTGITSLYFFTVSLNGTHKFVHSNSLEVKTDPSCNYFSLSGAQFSLDFINIS